MDSQPARLRRIDDGGRMDVQDQDRLVCLARLREGVEIACSVAARLEADSIGLSACTCLQNCRNDCSLLVYFCRSLDHSSDRVRLRDKNSVASAHFGDLGARTLIHPALQLRAYDVIL